MPSVADWLLCLNDCQDDILRRAVQVHKGKNWKKIGEQHSL